MNTEHAEDSSAGLSSKDVWVWSIVSVRSKPSSTFHDLSKHLRRSLVALYHIYDVVDDEEELEESGRELVQGFLTHSISSRNSFSAWKGELEGCSSIEFSGASYGSYHQAAFRLNDERLCALGDIAASAGLRQWSPDLDPYCQLLAAAVGVDFNYLQKAFEDPRLAQFDTLELCDLLESERETVSQQIGEPYTPDDGNDAGSISTSKMLRRKFVIPAKLVGERASSAEDSPPVMYSLPLWPQDWCRILHKSSDWWPWARKNVLAPFIHPDDAKRRRGGRYRVRIRLDCPLLMEAGYREPAKDL